MRLQKRLNIALTVALTIAFILLGAFVFRVALLYQPKKNTNLSAYGGSGTNATYRNINGRFTPRYSQAEN